MSLNPLRRVESHEMGTGHIAGTMARMALPFAISGLLAHTYQLVDMVFIGWLGTDEVTGAGFSFPALVIIFALAQAAGVGVATLASARLGQDKRDEASDVLNHGLMAALLVGGLMSAASVVAPRPILTLLGAEGDILHYGTLYLERMMLGSLLVHLFVAAEAGLRSQGNTVTTMKAAMVGNAINLVLDGFFIFGSEHPAAAAPDWAPVQWLTAVYTRYGLDLGIQGGATITVLSRGLIVAMLMTSLWYGRSGLRPFKPWRRWPRLRWPVLSRLYMLGFPASLGIVCMSLSAGGINLILSDVDPQAVGALFIASRLEMVVFMPMFSLGATLVPFVSYNLGRGDLARSRSAIGRAMIIAGVYAGVFGAVMFAFPQKFIALFNDEPEMLRMGSMYLKINAWSYAIVGFDVMLSNGFQGLGHPLLSMLVQLIRTMIVKLPLAWLLAIPLGVAGVWWSSPISTIVCFVTASTLMVVLLRKLSAHEIPANDD